MASKSERTKRKGREIRNEFKKLIKKELKKAQTNLVK